eukprot:TRINITY_DN4508_c0_g1_i2.p1 TRINITY_DN4508_c0_g1~~TRINITY_DN4508_c0_g1_i2.p1  ORF type:complete len:193 (+),score=15.65 TRINITY_DN4508_c0_g1_i2:80-658(+)
MNPLVQTRRSRRPGSSAALHSARQANPRSATFMTHSATGRRAVREGPPRADAPTPTGQHRQGGPCTSTQRGQLLGEFTQLPVLQYNYLYRDLVAATTRVLDGMLEELGMHKRPVLCLDASNPMLVAQALAAESLQGITADGLIQLNRPILSFESRSPPPCTVRKSDSLWRALQQQVTRRSTRQPLHGACNCT